MSLQIPQSSEKFGFIVEGFGAHSGRTIMLKDMDRLLDSCPQNADFQDYHEAIIESNVLLKETGASRKEANTRLKRLYGLENSILLFKIFKQLWFQDPLAQPIVLILYAIARDPILRGSVDSLLDTKPGEEVTAKYFEGVLFEMYQDQLSNKTLASIGRNIASSWTQSGHLLGRSRKTRTLVQSYPTSVAFALLLGHLCGSRGEMLFQTRWSQLLDTSIYDLHLKAQLASKQGWLEYRRTGNIIDITFDHFLGGVDL